MEVRGHSGIAKSADQNGVEVAGEDLKAIRRNGGAVFEVAVRAPIEVGQVNRYSGCLDYLDRLRDDFLADAIAGNDGNCFASAHRGNLPQALSTQHSALSTQHSALSTQHSALSTQHSALSTQHSALSTQQSANSS